MQTLNDGYRALSLVMTLNWDRVLYIFTVIFALFIGSLVGSL
ncbi:hypothetical protein [Aliishimia ponticola]|nr:hypothetical protein [Aliishimia ponticola]